LAYSSGESNKIDVFGLKFTLHISILFDSLLLMFYNLKSAL